METLLTLIRNDSIVFVVSDPFGYALANACANSKDSVLPQDDFFHNPERSQKAIVFVSTYHDEDVREQIDAIGAELRIPTIGLELLPTRIVCGPVVLPGKTACYRCYRKRISQHTKGPTDYGEESSTQGLEPGYAKFHVAIAAGLLKSALVEINKEQFEQLGGTVRIFNLVSGNTSAYETVSVDRCARCGHRFASDRDFELFARRIEMRNV